MLGRMSSESFSERMAAAARELQDQHDPDSTIKNAVMLLVQNVDGCDAASISMVHSRRGVETEAASDDTVVIADRLQVELGEGPCLEAIWTEETVYVPDLATDPRWSTWGPRVAEATGARSALAIRLFTAHNTLGALNLYSVEPDGFSARGRAEGSALAAHIAIAVAAAKNIEQLEEAMETRTVIAQACGMMMERFGLDRDRAFALLTRLSSHQNIKLREVAAEIVRTRQLPEQPGNGDG